MNNLLKLLFLLLFLFGILVAFTWWLLGPITGKNIPQVFILSQKTAASDTALKLKEQDLIKSTQAFSFLLSFFGRKDIVAGGYRLNKNMNAWQILQKITKKPDLVWITIPEGWRKEQIGQVLAKELGWSPDEEQKWNEVYTTVKDEYIEGVYFPDTYLIPIDETGQQVAQRFINRFNEKFAPFIDQFTQKNIRWTTGLKIASLIQREAAGIHDMALISGIIWNRLDQGMKLEIDATLQYIRGNKEDGWWGKVDIADKKIDSPYNTYMYKVLPPYPICNSSIAAIEAALNPAETDCLFYLHDHNRQIHCAKTYEEHKENINKYL